MRYLVIGGSGYLGAHLIDSLTGDNHDVINFDDHSGNMININSNPAVTNILGDIRFPNDFSKLKKLGNIDGVFHLAAKKSVPESIMQPKLYEQVNIHGTNNVIEYCEANGIQNIVYTSSAAVYGEVDSSSPVCENFGINPINPYGRTKYLAEEFLQKSTEAKLLSGFSLRIFNMAGSSRKEFFDRKAENVLPVIVTSLIGNSLFTVNGKTFDTKDGTCVRDYVNVVDVVQAHRLAMEYLQNGPSGNYKVSNICTGVGTSILDIIDILNNISERKLKYIFGEKRYGDPSSVLGDFSLANQLLGWSPKVSIAQSIKESLDSLI